MGVESNVLPAIPESAKAWAAGFWEGEGSVDRGRLTASQKDPWILERLVVFWGGKLKPIKGTPHHQWWLCGAAARQMVSDMWPYLSPRRKAQINSRLYGKTREQLSRAAKLRVTKRERRSNGQFGGVLSCQPS